MYMFRCQYCGEMISKIQRVAGKGYVFVNPQQRKFVIDLSGDQYFVTEDGCVFPGVKPKPEDKDVHTGYLKHTSTCTRINRRRIKRYDDT